MPAEAAQYLGVRFSPDGNYLYFVRGETGQALKYLYRAPVLGGTAQKLVTDVDSNITFSPDGRNLAYVVDNNPELGKLRLVVYSLQSGEGKTLVTGSMSQRLLDAAWSPDGKTIVCSIIQPGDALGGLVAVDAVTGKQDLIFESKNGILTSPAWLPDGSGLLALYIGKETNLRRAQIVEVSSRRHQFHAVTHDINNYSDLSLSADGHLVATVLSQARYDLFVAGASELSSGQVQPLNAGPRVNTFAWTPDGQIIVDNEGLYLLRPDSGSKTPLAPEEQDGVAFQPASCANGRYVVASVGGHAGAKTVTIWRMDASGGNLKQLSDGKLDENAVCSPDGKWVYYSDLSNGAKPTRVPLDGGKPERLTELPTRQLDISPDGTLAAFASFVSPSSSKEQLVLMPVDAPQNVKFLELQRPVDGSVRFTHDGNAVVYPFRDGDADNLWLEPLDGSPGKQITNFKSEQITDFHWSFDGSKVGMIRGHTESDVVLLEESKP
jgi:Tol biopolymer transport system component